MFSTKRYWLLGCVAMVGFCAFAAHGVFAQQLTIPGKGKLTEIIKLKDNNLTGGETIVMHTVPPGRKFVMTDVILSNSTASDASEIVIYRTSTDVFLGVVPAKNTISHAFTTRIEFAAGETVAVFFQGAGTDVNVMITGYEVRA